MKIDIYITEYGEKNKYYIDPYLDGKIYKDCDKETIKKFEEILDSTNANSMDSLYHYMRIRYNSKYDWFNVSMLDEFLDEKEKWLPYGIHIDFPDTYKPLCEFEILADMNGNDVMTYIAVDGKPISPEEYELLKRNCGDYVEINGQRVYSTMSIIKHHEKKHDIASFLIEMRSIDDSHIIFKEQPLERSFKFDNSGNMFKKHQVEAIEFIVDSFRSKRGILLADDMGLGKTATAIGVMSCMKSDKPSIVVVPKSVVGNWIAEFGKFAPDVRCYPYKGSLIKGGCVYIATYGDVLHDLQLCGREYATVVLDEAQQIKNRKTVVSSRLRAICAENRLAMTGTPMENTIMDLWTIMDFVQHGLLGDYNRFKNVCDYDVPLCRLLSCIRPYCIRRMKSEIDSLELPAKTEHIVSVDLSDYEKRLYNAIIDEYKMESEQDSSVTVLKYLTKLKMMCGNPRHMFKIDTEPSKLAHVREIIGNSGYKPFVIFTQFRDTAELILENLNRFYGKDGIIIDGTLSAKERTNISNKFQNGEYPFIVLTLKAGNCGLTLTNSCNLIHYDRWWNPAVENQATDRVYRIGQRHDVNIYKLVCRDTVEERISSILDSKTRLFNSVVEIIKENKELLERKM